MGLFSFVKEAGEKLFNRKPKKSVPSSIETASKLNRPAPKPSNQELYYQKVAVLEEEVEDLGLKVTNLCIELSESQDSVKVHGEAGSQADREKIVLALGNVNGICEVHDEMTVEVQPRFYTVKSGDTLSKIAKTFYGDAMKYPQIFEANKPMLKSPDLIYPGQMLRIPE